MHSRIGEVYHFDYLWQESPYSADQINLLRSLFDRHPNLVTTAEIAYEGVKNEIRRSEVIWLDDNIENLYPNSSAWIYNPIIDLINEVNDEYYKFNIEGIESLQLTRYDAKHGSYNGLHADCMNVQNRSNRKLTFVVQLSDIDEYEGCEFSLIGQNISREMPQQFRRGNIIFFPSTMAHSVSTITKGTRYALVGWVVGERWK